MKTMRSLLLFTVALSVTISCNNVKNDNTATLEVINSEIDEASGITFAADNTLWVVDDEGLLYNLTTQGEILKYYDFEETNYEMDYDFEGVAYNHIDNTLLIAIEGDELLGIFSIAQEEFIGFVHLHDIFPDVDSGNSGIEGIVMEKNTIHFVRQSVYDQTIDSNAALLCTLHKRNSKLTRLSADRLPFADASALTTIPNQKGYVYIIADTEDIIYKVNISTLESSFYYNLPKKFEEVEYEGITVSPEGEIYIAAERVGVARIK